jgi:hypothetical protein
MVNPIPLKINPIQRLAVFLGAINLIAFKTVVYLISGKSLQLKIEPIKA